MCFFNKKQNQIKLEKAKKIFYANSGSHFRMWQNGVISEYEKYKVPKSIEETWLNDIKRNILEEISVVDNGHKIVLIHSYIHLLDDYSAIDYLFSILDLYCWDTYSYIILLETLKSYSFKVDINTKKNIENKLLFQKNIILNKKIVIDNYYKSSDYLHSCDFTTENIIKRINQI